MLICVRCHFTLDSPSDRMIHLSDRMDLLSDRTDHLSDRMDHLSDRTDYLSDRMDPLSGWIDLLSDRMVYFSRSVFQRHLHNLPSLSNGCHFLAQHAGQFGGSRDEFAIALGHFTFWKVEIVFQPSTNVASKRDGYR